MKTDTQLTAQSSTLQRGAENIKLGRLATLMADLITNKLNKNGLTAEYAALLTQSTVTSTSGALVVGKTYVIATVLSTDSFGNVGFVSANVNFIATGTTPTTWTNSTIVTNVTDSAPAVTVLKNTLSAAIVWVRTSSGLFTGTLAGAFLSGKILCFHGQSGATVTQFKRATDDTVTITCTDNAMAAQSIKIEVYL